MEKPANVFEHPLHPMLVSFPIGLLSSSVFCDLMTHLRHEMIWYVFSIFLLGGGVVTGLVAAVPGFIDWLAIDDLEVKKIGLIHMGSNVCSLLLFSASCYLRVHRSDPGKLLPVFLSLGGLLLLSVGGWLGGSLVYKHRVAVQEKTS